MTKTTAKFHKITENRAFIPVCAMIISGLVYFICAVYCGINPFGDKKGTLVVNDAFYQYLDFFSWYKDILSGKASFTYSFSNGLGENSIGILSTYLMSPFNLLIVFFPKENLEAFYNLLTPLKLIAAAGTSGVFFQIRFSKCPKLYLVLSAVSYGLIEYFALQSFNMMWLDAVYLLPMVLLGVYYSIKNGRTWFLSLFVGIAILVQWYQGAIVALFSGFYFLTEVFVYDFDNGNKVSFKTFVFKALNYVKGMLVGVMISSVLFIPTVYVLKMGKGSSMDLSYLSNEMLGNVTNTILYNYPGSTSDLGRAALFCGSFIIVGVIGFFIQRKGNIKIKIALGALLAFIIASFYYKPLFFMFSLFKISDNFHYRYAYLGCFVLIYISLMFYRNIDKNQTVTYLIGSVVYILVYTVLNILNVGSLETKRLLIIFEPVVGILVILALVLILEHHWNKKVLASILKTLLVLTICFELGLSTVDLLRYVNGKSKYDASNYQTEQIELIAAVENIDDGLYRVVQNQTRTMNYQKETVCFNEPLAFRYMSMASYTSCPENTQLNLLSELGYQTYKNCMSIKTLYLLPVDSVFGVKYILSPYEVDGANKVSDVVKNGSSIYENPYQLPLMFKMNEESVNKELFSDNTFDNWNNLYKALGNTDACIMSNASFEETVTEDMTTYKINVPRGNYVLYGQIKTTRETKLTLNLNDKFSIPYGNSVCADVFNVPSNDEGTYRVTIDSSDNTLISDVNFYLLDLDVLNSVCTDINGLSANILKMEDGKVEAEVDSDSNQILFTSIPADKGWTVKVNGKKVETGKFGDCLITIPLESGTNKIDMAYNTPYLLPSLFISICGLGLTCLNLLKKKSSC